jgi:RNA polymerase sigma-32 factor
MRRVRAFPLLAPEEERALARKARQDEDAAAVARLTTSHLRLVAKVARRYSSFGLPMSELIAEGNLGMVRAVQRFDPDRGFRLSTFAVWWIRAAIQEYILRSWSLVRIGTTRGQRRLFFNLRRLKSSMGLLEEGELAPGQVEKIAASLGVPRAEVVSMNGRLAGADLSLNVPVGTEGDSELQDWLVDERPTPEDALAEAEERHHRRRLLKSALGMLQERERHILVERRLKEPPATLNELSRRYDVSAERVRQIELAAYERLKSAILHASSAPRAFPASGGTGSRRDAGQLAPDCALSLCSMADAKPARSGLEEDGPQSLTHRSKGAGDEPCHPSFDQVRGPQ